MAINRDTISNGFSSTMTVLGVVSFVTLIGLGIGKMTGRVKVSFNVIKKKEEQSGQSE